MRRPYSAADREKLAGKLETRVAALREELEAARRIRDRAVVEIREQSIERLERRIRSLRREPNQPIETPAGIVSVGSRIRVEMSSLLESGDDLTEVTVRKIWPSGRLEVDRAIEGTPFGDMPILVAPENVLEVVDPEREE